MNSNQLESAGNLPVRNSKKSRNNRLTLLISSLLVAFSAGYFISREIQLDAAQKSIRDCTEKQDCSTENISALEKLVKAKKSLNLFNLESAHLEGAHLKNADLKSSNLESAHLENAHLENAHLENVNLSIAHLENAHLENAHLENVNLSNANLEGANFQGASLKGAYISHDKLKGAYFNLANLQGVHLYHADFEKANFHRANLSHTYLYRSNFNRAIFYGANLQGAHLIEAQNLTPAQIKSACNWEIAIYKGVWDSEQSKWVTDEQANRQFIKQLQQDKDSNPKKPVDCNQWE